MTESLEIAELAPEDVTKLQEELGGKTTYGCLIFITAILLILGFFLGNLLNSLMLMAIFLVVALAISGGIFYFLRQKNAQISEDIWRGRKNVIIAPIQSKRVDSSEITHGRNRGSISSKYFMTLRGKEYDMTERRYLTIKVGEFMELHVAPLSGTILKQRWLKEDGTEETEIADGQLAAGDLNGRI